MVLGGFASSIWKSPMLSLVLRTLEFFVYHLPIVIVDRVSRLPRTSAGALREMPEIMRLYRENLALEAQNGALLLELDAVRGKRPAMPVRVRAAQVFAYLLTRGDHEFQGYYLGASVQTLKRWAAAFRRGPWSWRRRPSGGRPPLDESISYYQAERSSQALDGQTPAAFGRGEELGEEIDLDAIRRSRLVRRSRAHGLLNSYELSSEGGGREPEREAA